MITNDSHAWWSRLRHQGLLLSPVVMLERYPDAPQQAPFHKTARLRDAFTRFAASGEADSERATLAWADAVLEGYLGNPLARQHSIPEKLNAVVRVGSRTETIRPHRVVFADAECKTPALLVMADSSPQVGRGRGRTAYARFLELLRGCGHRLGLLTNGRQFRLVYAGLDFESWCEWESDRWFDDGDGSEELAGLRRLLSPDSLKPVRDGVSGLFDAVEESRKRQADLSSVLRENVRQAIEILLEEVSSANRTDAALFTPLVNLPSPLGEGPDMRGHLPDAEAHEALLQATVRVVMRLVVCLFAESRQLLPVNDPVYAPSYGVRSLYEMLEEASRDEGGTHGLMNRQTAWPRLMALFRLIYRGSAHGQFPMRGYGGALFRPGDDNNPDAVVRALHILEHKVSVSDATIYHVLRKLLRGPLPVVRGRAKAFVEGPVDYTDLRTEFIGLIYEGLLDYKLKRTTEQTGPQVFLNLGREPVLPLSRLQEMLEQDKNGLKNLLTTLKKENVGGESGGEDEAPEGDEEQGADSQEIDADTGEGAAADALAEAPHGGDYLGAVEAARRWAREAVVLAGLVGKQGKREPNTDYQARIGAEADRLIRRVVSTGEFYLVRAGNTRKGTGTFYTRPQLAVPTVHRTLEPLCYDKGDDGVLTPKTPEAILGLKVCDPACGSASFPVACLHYLTEALYRSLCHHRKLDDPSEAKKVTLPYGRPRTGRADEELVAFSPDDPQRGDTFADRVKAVLRRHVVERCVYGVDINQLAVEFARVSLWIETLDPELPFSFLDHKIKVGNSLVGCWLDRVLDYPLRAWEREGGSTEETDRIESLLKGPKQANNRRTGDGIIKREMRAFIQGLQPDLFSSLQRQNEQVVGEARREYESLHELPGHDAEERERFYREHVQNSPALQKLKGAMDRWCALWFWLADEKSLHHVYTPANFGDQVVDSDESRRAEEVIQDRVRKLRFFHWELEFPDVFTPERRGFDAMIGNPPWDVMKPSSQEYFIEYDPLFRTYEKQEALKQQQKWLAVEKQPQQQRRQRLAFASIPGSVETWEEYNAYFKAMSNWAGKVAEPFDLALGRGNEEKTLKSAWERHRRQHVGFADTDHPFRLQGSADLNSYKMFTEVFWHLLRQGGRLGVILPTGIYSDYGTRDLRETLLTRGRIELIYAFQNEKRVFSAAHHSFKQVALFATKGGSTRGFLTRFRMGVGDSPHAHELPDDILKRDDAAMCFTPEDVKRNSPKTLSLVELRSERDLAVFRTIYANSTRIADTAPGWEMTYAAEFHMTGDSKRFPPLEKWEAKGYRPDEFGRWSGPEGMALPLYQGRVIHHFNFWTSQHESGKGANAKWIVNSFDAVRVRPMYLMDELTYKEMGGKTRPIRIAIRDVARSTDTRTMIVACVPSFPCNHKIPILTVGDERLDRTLEVACVLSSFVFDWVVRVRLGGASLAWSMLTDCPLPRLELADQSACRLIQAAGRLTFLHRRFAPEWLRLRQLYLNLASREWKHWWAVTEADRLRLRVEGDALAADLYGISPDDFDWIVRDDPTDAKGFYRVDRQLPFRERVTGLAAAAFRALKAGRWSAEVAGTMSNDEFFAAIGVPEMTAGAEPLIRKREGCHRWTPEEFGPDDPRHGWTWEDCWNDAVALLGSEDAVRKYVRGDDQKQEKDEQPQQVSDLSGQPLKPRQGHLF